MMSARARHWWRGGVGAALLLCGAARPLQAQEQAWVLVRVKRDPIFTSAEKAYYLHVKDTSTTDGNLSATFIIEWTSAGRTVNRQIGWTRPPQKLKPGDVWQGSGSGDTTRAQLWTRMGLSREDDGALSGAQGGPGGTTLQLPAAHDPDHPYLMIGVDAKLIHQYAHEGGDRQGAAIPQDSDEVARGDPVSYRRVYTTAGTSKASASVSYTYVYKWGATESEMADPAGTLSVPPDWKTIVGGGALAAVAAAMAALYWKRRRASGDNSTTPPDGPVGYVLQLSNDRFTLQQGESAALTVTVWAVDYKGATSLAQGASIAVQAPPGLSVAPGTGSGRLVAHLTATPQLAEGAYSVAVSAQAGGSTYNASVVVTAGVAYVYTLSLSQSAINLQRDGAETVSARVNVTGPDANQCERESQRLGAAITFTLAGKAAGWFAVREMSDGGARAGILTLTIPEGASKLPGPHLATYTAQVDAPTGRLVQACTLTITTSDAFELAMDRTLRLVANDVAGSLLATIVCKDNTIADAAALIAAATPAIHFTVDGAQAHWISEEGGRPGRLTGARSGGSTPGKEVHPLVEVPLADLPEQPPFRAAITATVDIPRYGSFTAVANVEIAPPKWFVELQPIKDKLKAGIDDSAVFRARVLPVNDTKLPLYTEGRVNALNRYLTFYADGPAQPFAQIAEHEGDGEFREYEVRLGEIPKGTPIGEYLDFVGEAVLCGQSTSQRFRINLSGKPTLESKQKSLTLVNEGEPGAVTLKVKNGDEFTWALRVEVIDVGEVEPDGPPESDDGRNFTLRLRAGEGPEGGAGLRTGALRVTASTTNPETQEEIVTEPLDVPLKVGRVGLTVSPSPVRLASDPLGPPATFRVRVLRFNDATQAFESVPSAMNALELGEWEDGDATAGANVFKGAGVTLTYVRTEGSGVNAVAVWNAKSKLVIPAATPIDAVRELTAPGDFGDQQECFTTQHTFIAPVDPASTASMKIKTEQANCRKILRFLPDGPEKTKFSEIIEKDAQNLGAEGLHWQRQKIWNAAREALAQDAASYLASARMYGAMAEACDWVAYINGLIVQGMSSVLCPFPSDVFVNVLYGALPDFVNAAWEGRAREWPGEWANSFYAGMPGMGVDMALGMAVNLEDLIKKGVEKSKDIRKACVAACAAYWAVRCMRWYNSKKPDGEPYSLEESAVAALKDLVNEIVTLGIGKNTKFEKMGLKSPGVTGWVSDYDPALGHGYDPKDGRVYHDTKKLPDTRGMPDANLKAAQDVARKNGVEIYVRPTNAASRTLLEQGALPKPEKIKSKTINELDLQLGGRRKEDLGKVGYFDPGPEPPKQGALSKEDHAALVERYNQRKQEFADNEKDFKKLGQEHVTTKPDGSTVTERVTVDEHGVVQNHSTTVGADGVPKSQTKVYTGDHDIYDIRGKDGAPLKGAEYDKIVQQLKDAKFAAQHPGHRQWDYTKEDKTLPPQVGADGNPAKKQSKYEKAKGIDEKIRNSHQSQTSSGKPGEALIKVGSNGNVSGVHSDSPATMKTHSTQQRVGKAATAANRDREEEMGGAP